MENNNQKQQQQQQQSNDDSDSNKKESTNSGGNDDTPSTSSSKPKDIIHDDVCSICFDDVSIMDVRDGDRRPKCDDVKSYYLCMQCGKVMHTDCVLQLIGTKSLSLGSRGSCPMCRAPFVDEGSEEQIETS